MLLCILYANAFESKTEWKFQFGNYLDVIHFLSYGFEPDKSESVLPNYQVGSATFPEATNTDLPNSFCRIDTDSLHYDLDSLQKQQMV
jgi:hypothetical protein